MQFSSSKALLEYIRKEPNFDLLNLLKEDRLEKLEAFFLEREDGLTFDEFIYIIFNNFEFDYSDPELKELISLKLLELFKEIDINDDHSLEWSEFSNHIIQLSSISRGNTEKDNILLYKQSNKRIQVKVSKTADTHIDHLVYHSKTGQLILVEQNSPKFMVFNIDDRHNNWKPVIEQVAHKKNITCVELFTDPKDMILTLATASIDLTINFWALSSRLKLKKTLILPEIPQVISFYYDPSSDVPLIFTGGNDASIRSYDMNTLRDKSNFGSWNPFVKLDAKQKGHSGPISDLVSLPELGFIVSSGLDGRICLWEVSRSRFVKYLSSDSKLKSIASMTWIDDLSALLTGGLDHDIHVYNTYVSEKIYSVKGHSSPISKLQWIKGSFEVVSADIGGVVKIWDYRSWKCLQTFSIGRGITSLSTGILSKQKKKIFIGGKNLVYFVTDELKNENLTDEDIAVSVLYNAEFRVIFTIHEGRIKLWKIDSGKIYNIFRDLLNEDILAFCFDDWN